MDKAADIIRILDTPHVKGELKYKNGKILKFDSTNDNIKYWPGELINIQTKYDKVILYKHRFLADGLLEQILEAKDFTLLWCSYPGIMNN